MNKISTLLKCLLLGIAGIFILRILSNNPDLYEWNALGIWISIPMLIVLIGLFRSFYTKTYIIEFWESIGMLLSQSYNLLQRLEGIKSTGKQERHSYSRGPYEQVALLAFLFLLLQVLYPALSPILSVISIPLVDTVVYDLIYFTKIAIPILILWRTARGTLAIVGLLLGLTFLVFSVIEEAVDLYAYF